MSHPNQVTRKLTNSHSVDEWLDYILGDPADIKLGLDRIDVVYQALATQKKSPAKIISVAGTNGKGSTIAMMEAVLLAHGQRVGVFSSPHLYRVNERYRINGQLVADQAMVDGLVAIDAHRGDVQLTYFEYTTLLAWWLFADAEVDYMLLEVGLGGRLDAVNVFAADVAAITSIGLDHCDRLGDTLAEIGAEKAGICRRGRPAIIGQDESGLLQRAEKIGAKIVRASHFYDASTISVNEPVDAPFLASGVPLSNAVVALLALRAAGESVTNADVALVAKTTVPGRFQHVVLGAGKPDVIIDVAHNAEAAAVLNHSLARRFGDRPRYYVFATLADKPYERVIAACESGRWFVAKPDNDRGVDPLLLQPFLPSDTLVCQSVDGAIESAVEAAIHSGIESTTNAGPAGVVVVFGAFATVAAALQYFRVG